MGTADPLPLLVINFCGMKVYTIIFGVCWGQLAGVHAGDFSTGFGADYNHPGKLSGQNGWIIDDPAPDLSFFVRLNGSDAAALGSFYDTPAALRATLSHPVGIPLTGSSFRVSAAIVSSTALFPGRDVFGWSLTDPAGDKLFTLRLVPAPNNADLLNITWVAGTGVAVATGRAISYSAPYKFDLKFTTAGGADAGFTASITGSTSLSFSGLLPGMAGKTWASVGADFIVDGGVCGDNFMVFDDLNAVTLPMMDADGDGYSAETEAWFGTSDISCSSSPVPELSFIAGLAALRFPSVVGNSYSIESSDDLIKWVAMPVTADASTTTWQESEPSSGPRFFRIRKP